MIKYHDNNNAVLTEALPNNEMIPAFVNPFEDDHIAYNETNGHLLVFSKLATMK